MCWIAAGIAEDDVSRAFQRFYKADGARTAGGSGLGVSIALEHARAQGGILDAENREGGGARFTFRLPAARDEAPVATNSSLRSPQAQR